MCNLLASQAIATKPIAVNQFETHPYYQRTPLLEYCTEHGIVVTAHSSLGGAANAMSKFHSSPPLKDDPVVARVAAKHNTTPQAVLLRWAMTRPTACIPKSVTPARIQANLDAVLALELDAEDLGCAAVVGSTGSGDCVSTEDWWWMRHTRAASAIVYTCFTAPNLRTHGVAGCWRLSTSRGSRAVTAIRRRRGSAARSSPAAPIITMAERRR